MRYRLGFTLIELSIVLVIIGLLAGGILVGRDLIRASELQAVIAEVDKFKSAVNAFRLKYNCIPGDCTTATNYWGTDPGGCPLTPSNDVIKTATCNGSGTGAINNYDGSYNTHPEEMFRFWQHLANAQLIKGGYTGAVSSGGPETEQTILDLNVPSSKFPGAGWIIHYWPSAGFPGSGSPLNPSLGNMNYFTLVGDPNDYSPFATDAVRAVSGTDARFLDSKIDDGLPYSGIVIPLDMILIGNSRNCTTTFLVPTDYTNGNTAACSLAIRAGF